MPILLTNKFEFTDLPMPCILSIDNISPTAVPRRAKSLISDTNTQQVFERDLKRPVELVEDDEPHRYAYGDMVYIGTYDPYTDTTSFQVAIITKE